MANNQACFPLTLDSSGQPVLNQITKVRLSDGQEVAIVDWQWHPLYSTLDTLSGWSDSELRTFTYTEGDPIATSSNMTVKETATLKHTNITSASEMDALEEMLVYAMCVEMYQLTEGQSSITDSTIGQPIPEPNNIARLHAMTILELEVSQKDYFRASTGWFPPGFGAVPTTTNGASNNGSFRMYATNSHASREALDMAPVPVHIGGTEKYSVILHNPDAVAIRYRADNTGSEAATAVMRLRINLYGLHKRPSG